MVVPVLIAGTLLLTWVVWRSTRLSVEAETRRLAAQHSQTLYRDLVEGSLQGLLIHADFKPLFVNPAFARMFGFTDVPEAMALPSFLDLVAEDDQDDVSMVHGMITSGRVHTWTGRVHCVNRRGESVWVEELARPIRWRGEPAAQVTLMDVTDRVAYENDLELARSLTEQQSQEVVALAEELDVALQLAEEQKAQLHKLSVSDPLTGAFNRRHFMEQAQQERARMGRQPDYRVSVLMIDLDHFKAINDTYGHAVGDEALRVFTVLCNETLRENDVFGRLGGEEFAALLPGTGLDEARLVAERLRAGTATVQIAVGDGRHIGLTASLGVAEVTDAAEPFDAVLSRADAALYRSKAEGRDRVTMAAPPDRDGPAV
nr:sensor domain-containing diguanylate cyclase [Roseospira navarrensis]